MFNITGISTILSLLFSEPSFSFQTQQTNAILYAANFTQNVTPLSCHSHNDYWRRTPLYEALASGCTGIEADVWLFDNELFIGHNTYALIPNRTFRSMYVEPLLALLDSRNQNYNSTRSSPPSLFSPFAGKKNIGLFAKDPQRAIVLLVDFKNNGGEIYTLLSSQLSVLREKGYLTYFNGESNTLVEGPVMVVATGNAPFDLILDDKNDTTSYHRRRDIFFDAPLGKLPLLSDHNDDPDSPQSEINTSNSYYASAHFLKTIGFPLPFGFSSKQMSLMQRQIQTARQMGLKTRYYSVPGWPISLRNYIWEVLVEMGVDYLSGDDLVGMAGMRRRLGVEEREEKR